MIEAPKIVVFAGSSISKADVLALAPRAECRPPIRRGDLESIGSNVVCIIDGEFHQSLSISPLEIRTAINSGAYIIGASSMGALRALECAPVGMHGIGRIYELYKTAEIDADDEVAISMDPDTYAQVSDALVDVRVFLRDQNLDSMLSLKIISKLAAYPFELRSFATALDELVKSEDITAPLGQRLSNEFYSRPTQKYKDAVAAITQCVLIHDQYSSDPCYSDTRKITPEQMWALVEPQLPDCGISRVADITGLDKIGIPVFQAYRPSTTYPVSVYSGKGTTPREAKLGAVMEAIESFVLEQASPEARSSSVSDIGRFHLPHIAPEDLILPPHLNAESHCFDWVEVTSHQGQTHLCPKEAVLMPCPNRHWEVNTNGIASGSCLSEALLHATLEVIERDAVSLALVSCDARPVHQEYLMRPSINNLVSRIRESGLNVFLKDVTSDIGVPTFYCVLTTTSEAERFHSCSGAGTHFDPEEALRKAIIEAVQSHTCLIAGSREDLGERVKAMDDQGRDELSSYFDFWYSDFSSSDIYSAKTYPTPLTCSPYQSLNILISRLTDHGFRFFWADLSLSHLPVSVVRVIIPGLECFVADKSRIGKRIINKQPTILVAANRKEP